MMDCFGVQRNEGVDESASDQRQAQREREAREHLLAVGADQLERRPWQFGAMPPSAIDLIQFFLWRSSSAPSSSERSSSALSGSATSGSGALGESGGGGQEVMEAVVAALRLLPAARAEVDQLETGLLFAARGLGLTWAQMAEALGLNSPQACQQRLDRLTSRSSRSADGLAQ
ncbi:hypothetical protein [Kribbella sp. NPDC051620]|uniref:hypothetical protein n=1 Tax=Kribbella sp. NPDC051620 TaxID=3364120 RepID=UPI00379C4F97